MSKVKQDSIKLAALNKVGELTVFKLNLAYSFIFNAAGDLIAITHDNLKRFVYNYHIKQSDYEKIVKAYPEYHRKHSLLDGLTISSWNNGEHIFDL